MYLACNLLESSDSYFTVGNSDYILFITPFIKSFHNCNYIICVFVVYAFFLGCLLLRGVLDYY